MVNKFKPLKWRDLYNIIENMSNDEKNNNVIISVDGEHVSADVFAIRDDEDLVQSIVSPHEGTFVKSECDYDPKTHKILIPGNAIYLQLAN